MRTSMVRGLVLTVVALLVAACADIDSRDDGQGGLEGPAGEALATRIRLQGDRQFEALYAAIHPSQRSLINREDFVRCFERLDLPRVDRVEVLDTYEELIELPGTSELVHGMGVTVRVEQSQNLARNTSEGSFQVVEVEGLWYWVVDDPDAFADGCAE